MSEREREREAETQAEGEANKGRSRPHAGSQTWDSIPGLQDHSPAAGGAKPLCHRGCPRSDLNLHQPTETFLL